MSAKEQITPEVFLKGKGLNIKGYLIRDMTNNYTAKIPLMNWLDEYAEAYAQQKNAELKDENLKLADYGTEKMKENAELKEKWESYKSDFKKYEKRYYKSLEENERLRELLADAWQDGCSTGQDYCAGSGKRRTFKDWEIENELKPE